MSATTGKSNASSTDKKVRAQTNKPKPKVCGDLHKTSDEVLGRNGLLVDRAVIGDN